MRKNRRKDDIEPLDLQEKEDALIEKLFEPVVNEAGEIIGLARTDATLNLEELALAIWMMDGRREGTKPMTPMGALKFQGRVLAKLKAELKKDGIVCLNDIIDTGRFRRNCTSKFANSVDGD